MAATTPDQMLLDASGQNPQEMMLTMLHDALFPSHREWAAEKLAAGEERSNPRVIEALQQAARSDPAATVRATFRMRSWARAVMPCWVMARSSRRSHSAESSQEARI